MSRFAARMSTGLDNIYDRMGDQAVYTATSGYKTDCVVIVDRDLSRLGEGVLINGKTAVISVRASDVLEKPRRGETFSIDGECAALVVDSVISSDGLEHRCLVA